MKQLAIIGSTDKDTALYASKAKASGMILISDASTSDEFTDKSKYGNVFRLSFADSYRYATLANFLHSRSWKMVNILHGDKGVPGGLTAKLNLFGIRYVTTSFPRGVDGAKPVNKDTDSFFDNIKSSEVKIIVSVLDQTDLKYLIDVVAAEPEEDQLSTSNGYIWIFDGSLSDATQENPFESREGVTISKEMKIKNVKPFENGLVMRTYFEHFNLKSRAFQEACLQMDNGGRFADMCTVGVYEEGRNFHEGLMFYDAYAIYRESLLRLQLKQQTITAESLATEMRNYREPIDLSAMYGSLKYAQYKGPLLNTIGYNIKFDENNDRKNYTARLLQLHAPDPSQGNQIITSKKLLLLGEDVTPVNIKDTNKLTEVHFQEDREGGKVEQLVFQTDWIEEEDEDDVLVEVEVPVAPVGIDENSVVSLNSNYEKGKTDTQTVSLPFYCKGGCGGKRLNPALADGKYEMGTCVWNYGTKCICNSGYQGSSCQVAQCPKCNIDNGACVTPGVCTCKPGYKNDDSTGIACDIGHCEGVTSGSEKGCNPLGGTCQGGNTCKCSKSFYGPACRGSCKCKNSGICEDGAKGSGACDCTGTGYFGQYCHIHTDTVVVCGALGFVLFLVLFGLGVRYRMRQIAENQFLMSTDWRATWDEVKTKQANQRSSKKSMMSLMSMVSGAASGKDATKLTCANQAVWNGRDVVYKVIRKDRCDLGPELREEIKQVRQMAHPNICMFIGACLDAPNICILNEVCGKGSMEDILNNDDVNLGWDFKFSMMKDIARGMTYISNSVIESHGRLKSSNCLVDSRWCVKLADFGFQGMKAGQQGVSPYQPINDKGVPLLKSTKDMEGSDHFNLLWTAPEILATGVSHLDHVGKGTIRGDIYSMAMIMTEMCAHAHPYHEQQHLNPMQLIGFISRLVALDQKLQKTECRDIDGIPVYVLRPQLNDDDLPENTDQAAGLRTLIETCWNEDKMGRPDWNTLMKCLNKICPHSGELMDNLINLMESYTCSLEMIVAERTANIQEEKLKGDALLAKMLPPLICEELKSGKNPQPEFFKSVTIYFSDIVGFGALTSECAPIQVVAILNGLYEIMDSVIDSHDVYKVETIGDCYMVVSGLPIRNGDRHAGEICNMSLELLQAFNGVSYVGYEKKQVQLRVGIHSGPCVAGVVGTKMPRYCLFGDTVNTASRMESGGFALKIHLSSDTYTVLERLGGYKANCRGEIAVKGRGQMTTYWLQGREGTEYNLPSEDLALSASQHYFK